MLVSITLTIYEYVYVITKIFACERDCYHKHCFVHGILVMCSISSCISHILSSWELLIRVLSYCCVDVTVDYLIS